MDAVKGMPMILGGDAAEWWRGVKEQVVDFADVTRRLREGFSPSKPAWRIYAEVFDLKQQKSDPTKTFVRKKRALFSQLDVVPAEAEQLDMLFGMVHAQIWERVSRRKISSYEDLLSEAQEAELF
ncbi:activity-regulated cytoskeleton associated protein 1-like [Anastrepha ludens]|uniref:activity-regulated cytoskeleton associated protein 1-like n=1 Tax=Anastrepha ludens TaxID=28586 RepID=UPI0023B1DB69|nr:activity-regulated cytoskeleton associated protein 1-like [Anastrepha ludens]